MPDAALTLKAACCLTSRLVRLAPLQASVRQAEAVVALVGATWNVSDEALGRAEGLRYVAGQSASITQVN
jgi:hypothetical protein